MSNPAKGPGRGNHALRGKTDDVRRWLVGNPGEVLTFADFMARFDVTREQAHAICQALRNEGTALSSTVVYLNPERLRAT